MKVNVNPRYAGSRKKARIEMLPLIDIVFLLLVFFIFAMLSMAVHRSLPVVLPVSTAAQTDTALHLSITLKSNGLLFLDKTMLSHEELLKILRERALAANVTEAGPAVAVTIFADKDISYQQLYRVLDLIRTAGVSNVSLQATVIK